MSRKHLILATLLATSFASSPAICGMEGGTEAMNQINALLMECNHDDALAVLDQAESAGEMSFEMAEMERVIILYDAGRKDEADAAFANWQEETGADQGEVDRQKKGWELSLQQMQQQRRIETGSPTCK